MAGRKPKPTALKILEGEKNKDRINLNEPKPDVAYFSEVPDRLGDEGRRMWEHMAPILYRLGLTTEADYYAFWAMCREWDAYMDDGSTQHLLRCERMMGEFGMTPATRSRLTGMTNKDSEDPMVRVLAGGR